MGLKQEEIKWKRFMWVTNEILGERKSIKAEERNKDDIYKNRFQNCEMAWKY